MTVAGALAIFSALALGQSISSEIAADSPVITAASDNQDSPRIAFDGTNFLVVWVDGRNLGRDIYGARVSQAGALLDPEDIAIGRTGASSNQPSVAFDGTNYLVVWTTSAPSQHVYGARVSPGGVVVDANPVLLTPAANQQLTVGVAFGAGNYLLAWQQLVNNTFSQVFATRVTPGLALLDGSGFQVSSGTPAQAYGVSLAFNGTDFLAAWTGNQVSGSPNWDVYAGRISPDGGVLDPTSIPVGTGKNDQIEQSVATDGANFLVTWVEVGQLRAARVSGAGQLLDATSLALSVPTSSQGDGASTFDGTQYVCAWNDTSVYPARTVAARVTTAGQVLDDGGVQLLPSRPVVGGNALASGAGQTLLAVVTMDGPAPWDVTSTRLDGSLAALDSPGVLLSRGNNAEWQPVATFDGARYVLAWEDSRGTAEQEYVLRMSSAGIALDPAASVVPSSRGATEDWSASDGAGTTLVGWGVSASPSQLMWSALIDSAGVISDAGLLVGDAGAFFPSAAFDGTDFRIGLEENNGPTIAAQRVSPTGVAIDNPPVDLSQVGYYPRIACVPPACLMVWQGAAGIVSSGLGSNGLPVDGGALIADGGVTPDVATDGTGYLVVWAADAGPGLGMDLYARRVDAAFNASAAAFAAYSAPGDQINPRLAFDGTVYWLVWSDERTTPAHLWGTRIATGGAVLDPAGLVISQAATGERQLSLASSPGQVLALYDRVDPSLGASRVFVRILGDGGAPATDGGVVVDGGGGGGDGGTVADGGSSDGGVGSPDAGSLSDGGSGAGDGGAVASDGGNASSGDGGLVSRAPYRVGCGCSSPGDAFAGALLVAVAFVLRSRRRRGTGLTGL